MPVIFWGKGWTRQWWMAARNSPRVGVKGREGPFTLLLVRAGTGRDQQQAEG